MIKKQIKEILPKVNFENILILYIILQPIIDIITSLCVRNFSESLSFGTFIRTIFMIFIMVYTLIKVEKKVKLKILLYYLIIAIYCISFIFNSYTKYGFSMILTQIKGLIKTFYFPIILASFLVLYKNKEYKTKQKWLIISLSIYAISIFICKIFSCGYPTYPKKNNFGTIGLFFAGNETSAIIALLSPICFSTFITNKFNIWSALLCCLTVFITLEIGTKVSFISIVILIFLSLIFSIIKIFQKNFKTFWKQLVTLLLISVLTFLFVGNTSAGKNLNIKSFFFNESCESSFVKPKSDSESDSNQDSKNNDSKNNPVVLLSGRNNYLKHTITNYTNSSIVTKCLGIGYVTNENGTIQENKLVEIDYFDIFFCHGFIGALIYIIPLVFIIIISIKKFFIQFAKNVSDSSFILLLYSVLITFGIALLAGHAFTAPAVSIFLIFNLYEMLTILKNNEVLKNG